jgi:sugar phosphate permease
MVKDFGWTRAQVTSGNGISKLLIESVFGFVAGWMVDRLGPRHVMMAGILMGGGSLFGLDSISTLGFFIFSISSMRSARYWAAHCLVRCCCRAGSTNRGARRWASLTRAQAFAPPLHPWIANFLTQHFGWQFSLRMLGVLVVVMALPFAFFVKEPPQPSSRVGAGLDQANSAFKTIPFFLLTVGSMCSCRSRRHTTKLETLSRS